MSQAISADIPVPYLNSGWGITVVNSIEGALRTTNAHFVYSYHQKINSDFYISYGLGLGLLQQAVNSTELITPEGLYGENTISHNDLLLNNENFSGIAPSLNSGVLIRFKKIYAGISFDSGNFLNSSYSDLNVSVATPVKIALISHYEFMLGDSWSLIPSVQYKTGIKYHQFDVGVAADWNNFIELGINWRGYNKETFDAFVGIVALKLNEKLKFTYSYDYTLSEFNNISKGSHEIGIQYAIKSLIRKPSDVKKIYNTRYL